VELASKIVIYENSEIDGQNDGLFYSAIGKVNKKLESKLFLLASKNIISVKDNKIQCFEYNEILSMEWSLDSHISFIKLLPGLSR